MKKPATENQKTRPDLDDQAWIVWISMQPENKGIAVPELYRKMLDWCLKNGKTPTRLRLLNWLTREREAMPMTYEPPYFSGNAGSQPAPASEAKPDCTTCKNERFIETIVNPEAQFEWAKKRMVPCPACTKESNQPNG